MIIYIYDYIYMCVCLPCKTGIMHLLQHQLNIIYIYPLIQIIMIILSLAAGYHRWELAFFEKVIPGNRLFLHIVGSFVNAFLNQSLQTRDSEIVRYPIRFSSTLNHHIGWFSITFSSLKWILAQRRNTQQSFGGLSLPRRLQHGQHGNSGKRKYYPLVMTNSWPWKIDGP